MNIYNFTHRPADSSTAGKKTAQVVRGLSLNPLWLVTFAAGMLFGMLAVLLTAG